jgi:hypothetical protein
MSGGKGGQSTTKVEIPEWLEGAAQENLAKAGELSKIGYTPYYGPSVAAMTPMMQQSMAGTNQAAQAFGMGGGVDPNAGMPQAQNYGGVQAYSSGDMYDQALRELEARRPGQYAAMNAPFINPVTGAQPAAPYGTGQGGAGGYQTQAQLDATAASAAAAAAPAQADPRLNLVQFDGQWMSPSDAARAQRDQDRGR